MKFKWERIEKTTERAKVIGGWVVRSRDTDDCNSQYTVESMVFIPDHEHKWELANE